MYNNNNNKSYRRRNRIAQQPPHQQQQPRDQYKAETPEKWKMLLRQNLRLLWKIAEVQQ